MTMAPAIAGALTVGLMVGIGAPALLGFPGSTGSFESREDRATCARLALVHAALVPFTLVGIPVMVLGTVGVGCFVIAGATMRHDAKSWLNGMALTVFGPVGSLFVPILQVGSCLRALSGAIIHPKLYLSGWKFE